MRWAAGASEKEGKMITQRDMETPSYHDWRTWKRMELKDNFIPVTGMW